MSILSIGILAIVGIIVIAAIFDSNFQEKIFGGSEGEVRLGKFISVRGVSFVILLVGMIGLSIYHENLRPVNSDTILEEISNSNNYHFSLDFLKQDSLAVILNNTPVKKIHRPIKLSYRKSSLKKSVYDVLLEEEYYDHFDLEMTEYFLRYDGGSKIWQDSANRVNNSDFWFKLTDIETIERENAEDIASYKFMFGEGESMQNVKWINERFAFTKTDNGLPRSRIYILDSPEWNNSYTLILGAGKFGNILNNNYIEMATVNIIKIGLKKQPQ